MAFISVIGTGIGGDDYLIPLARRRISEADIVAGSPRHVERFAGADQETFVIESNWIGASEKIKTMPGEKRVAVLVSGNPNIYSFAALLHRTFTEGDIEIVPGISSYQYLAAKTGTSLNDAAFISFHGKGDDTAGETFDRLEKLLEIVSKIIVFTDGARHPGRIALELAHRRIGGLKVLIGRNLGLEDEEIFRLTLEECAETWEDARQLCIMILEK